MCVCNNSSATLFCSNCVPCASKKSEVETEMEKAERAAELFGNAFLVDGKFIENHRVQFLIKR